jgi:prepilin-type N-terminal cleavage/methylation domain-containing protein
MLTATHRVRSDEQGFTIIEMMVAVAILMVVCGIVMRGVLGLTDVSRMVSNRTDMHNGVRNATELLTQEIGQAGRISLPGKVTLAATALKGTNLLTVASTASSDTVPATSGMFLNEILLLGSDGTQEPVVVSAIAGNVVTLVDTLSKDHAAASPVEVAGGFAEGVIPPLAGGYANGSTGTSLKIFGDIHDDGRMVYVEYNCDFATGRLYRNSMAYNAGAKAAPNVEQVLIDNIEHNPIDPATGVETPCFTYQTQTVVGQKFVVDVAVTLTIHSQFKDKNTNDFQRETKALLNVAPRNVFNVWEQASLGMNDRVQPTPSEVPALLPPVAGLY